MGKPRAGGDPTVIPASTLNAFVFGYAKWAMRIEHPDSNRECLEMSRFLARRTSVELSSLARYIGSESDHRLLFKDLTVADQRDLDAVLNIYSNTFHEGPTACPKEFLERILLTKRREEKPIAYHLLSIKTKSEESPEGMASFFTFPSAGFVGYIVLDPKFRRRGYLAEVITAIERTVVLDRKGARGLFGECDPAANATFIFRKRGFYEIDICYRQPPLPGRTEYHINDAPILNLLYKELGERFAFPRLRADNLLKALTWIFRVVYQIDDPKQSEYYKEVERQLESTEYVSWKEKKVYDMAT